MLHIGCDHWTSKILNYCSFEYLLRFDKKNQYAYYLSMGHSCCMRRSPIIKSCLVDQSMLEHNCIFGRLLQQISQKYNFVDYNLDSFSVSQNQKWSSEGLSRSSCMPHIVTHNASLVTHVKSLMNHKSWVMMWQPHFRTSFITVRNHFANCLDQYRTRVLFGPFDSKSNFSLALGRQFGSLAFLKTISLSFS